MPKFEGKARKETYNYDCNFCELWTDIWMIFAGIWVRTVKKTCIQSCRSRQKLSNACLLFTTRVFTYKKRRRYGRERAVQNFLIPTPAMPPLSWIPLCVRDGQRRWGRAGRPRASAHRGSAPRSGCGSPPPEGPPEALLAAWPGLFIWTKHDSTGTLVAFQLVCLSASAKI